VGCCGEGWGFRVGRTVAECSVVILRLRRPLCSKHGNLVPSLQQSYEQAWQAAKEICRKFQLLHRIDFFASTCV
jgi:hypothetical protein